MCETRSERKQPYAVAGRARLPAGARITALGTVAVERARAGAGLTLRSTTCTTCTEGVRLLDDDGGDLHGGGIDDGRLRYRTAAAGGTKMNAIGLQAAARTLVRRAGRWRAAMCPRQSNAGRFGGAAAGAARAMSARTGLRLVTVEQTLAR